MLHRLFLTALIIPCLLTAQKQWDGGGGDNLWSNALNWTGNILPGAGDQVLLNQAYLSGDYTIILPGSAVTIASLRILPSPGRSITVTIPSSSKLLPALRVTDPGYSLDIGAGGIFKNQSGASSGTVIALSDSFRVQNGGRYIHQTGSSHAPYVQQLAQGPGTETGIIELDIPSASSTISFSGRVFGKLILKSTAAGGNNNYTAAGTSRVIIRDQLELGKGVTFNLNFSDTIFVRGNLVMDSSVLNLGNSSRSVCMVVEKNLTQSAGGVITESGSGQPSLMLAGENVQLVTFRGKVENQVTLVIQTGPVGFAWLKAPLRLPYRLKLNSGKILTSAQWMLTLPVGAVLETDTVGTGGYVEGPVTREGLQNESFLFPVGRGGRQRWLQLLQATGNFTVEYFKTDPAGLNGALPQSLHHLSSIEYWKIMVSANTAAAVKLSFVRPHSGGVTHLASLRVAKLQGSLWQDAGNQSTAGDPDTNGWVSSNGSSMYSAGTTYLTLAGASEFENPLPYVDLPLQVRATAQELNFSWKGNIPDVEIDQFELQQSPDGSRFFTVATLPYQSRELYLVRYTPAGYNKFYYRLRVRTVSGNYYEGPSCMASVIKSKAEFSYQIFANSVRLDWYSEINLTAIVRVHDMQGKLIRIDRLIQQNGWNRFIFPTAGWDRGIYIINMTDGTFNKTVKIMKQ